MRALIALLAVSSCTFDPRVPDDANITCTSDRECPSQLWRCVPELSRCVKLTDLTADAPSLSSARVSPELGNAGTLIEWTFVASADLLHAPEVSVLDGLASPLRRVTAEPSGVEQGWVVRTGVDGTERGGRLLATVKLVGTTARASPDLALPSVRLDFAPPQPGRTAIVLVPRAGCPLPSVRSLGVGGQALVSLAFDEDLDDAGVPSLRCVVDGGMQLNFRTESREQPFLFVADTTGLAPTETECALEVTARDVLGNAATKPVPLVGAPLTIDTLPPAPPTTSTPGAFVLERAPWPAAPGAFTGSRLRVAQPVEGLWLFASSTATPLSPLGSLRPDAGAPATLEFPFVDRSSLFVTAVDDACNESTGQPVTETNFLYGLVRNSVTVTESNPSRAFRRPLPTGGPLPLGQDSSSTLAADAGGLLLSSVGDWRELLPVNRSGSGGCVTDFLRGTVWVADGERLLRWDQDHLRFESQVNTPSLGVGRRLAIERQTGAVMLVSASGGVIARYDGQWTVSNTRPVTSGPLAPLTTAGGQLVTVANAPWFFDGGWAQPPGSTSNVAAVAGTMLSNGTLLGWFATAPTPQIQVWSERSGWARFADAPSLPVASLFADEASGRLFAVGSSFISVGPLDGGPLASPLAFDAGFAVQSACLVPRTGDVLLLANRLDAGVTSLLQFLEDGGVSASVLGDAGALAQDIQNAAGAMVPFEGRQVPALVWGTTNNAFRSQLWTNGGWRSLPGPSTPSRLDCFVDVTSWIDQKTVNVRHACATGLKPDRDLKDVSAISCLEAQWSKGGWEAVDSGVPCALLQRTATFGSERLDVVGAQPKVAPATTSWSNEVLVGNARWTTPLPLVAPSLLPLADGGLSAIGHFQLTDGGLGTSSTVFSWAGDGGWARQNRLPLSTSGSTFVQEPRSSSWWAPFALSLQSSVGLDFTLDPMQPPSEAPVVVSSQGTQLVRVEVASREGAGLPRPRMLPAVVPDPSRATIWLAGGRVVEEWEKVIAEAWAYSWALEYPAVMLHWKAPPNSTPSMIIDRFVLEVRSVSGPTGVSLWTRQGLVPLGTFDAATTRLEVAELAGRSFESAFADLGSIIFELRRPGPNTAATSPVSIVGVSAQLRYRQP